MLDHDVRQVQIAMAAAHEPLGPTGQQERRQGVEPRLGRRDQPLDRLRPQIGAPPAQELGVRGEHIGERVAPGGGVGAIRPGVEAGDLPTQGLGQDPVHAAGTGGEQRVFGKAPHLDQPVHGFAGPVEGEVPWRGLGDGADAAVKVRRSLAIEGDLPLAGPAPPLRAGEVEEAEVHRLLQLEHAVGEQDHPGDRGLDHLLGRRPLPRARDEPGEHRLGRPRAHGNRRERSQAWPGVGRSNTSRSCRRKGRSRQNSRRSGRMR